MKSVKAPIPRNQIPTASPPSFCDRLRHAIVGLGNALLTDPRNIALRSSWSRSRLDAGSFHESVSQLAFRISVLGGAALNVHCHNLLQCAQIEDRVLHAVNRLLRNPAVASPEELGRGYEAMLGWLPAFHRETGEFVLEEAGDRKRRETGSYYTASSLIDCLLDFAFEPILAAACSHADPETALLSLRICDPACGAGFFLLAAARRLARRLASVRSGTSSSWGATYRLALRTVIARCIFGVDRDGMAIEVCRLALLHEAKAPVSLQDTMKRNIVRADSLLDGKPFDDRFDLLIGNPPHGALRELHTRRRLEELYPSSRAAANSAAYFMELCSSWVQAQGIAGFIVPKSLTYSHDWSGLRQSLGDRLVALIDAGKAWKDVRLEQVVCVWRPLAAKNMGSALTGRWAPDGVVVGEPIDTQVARKLDVFHAGWSRSDRRLLRQLLNAESTLGDICSTRRGSGLQREIQATGAVPVIGGRDLADFRAPSVRGYLTDAALSPGLRIARPPQAVFQNIVSHITRPAPHIRLIGTVLRGPVACLDTVNLLTSLDPCWTAEAIAGLLMSDLVNWFIHVGVFNRAIRTMHFDGFCLAKIPAPPASTAVAFHSAARRIEADPTDRAAWEALNDVAFDAYAVSQPARKPITTACKPRWGDSTKTKGCISPGMKTEKVSF